MTSDDASMPSADEYSDDEASPEPMGGRAEAGAERQ